MRRFGINLFQIGNPLLDDLNNDKGSLEFLWNHGVMSDEMWNNISEHCSFGPSDGSSSSCDEAMTAFYFNFAKIVGNIYWYNIYAPICIQAPNGTVYSSSYVSTYICIFMSMICSFLKLLNPSYY